MSQNLTTLKPRKKRLPSKTQMREVLSWRMYWRSFLKSQPPLRAAITTILWGVLLLVLNRYLYERVAANSYTDNLILLPVAVSIIYAFRLHIIDGEALQQLIFDATTGVFGAYFLGLVMFVVVVYFAPEDYFAPVVYRSSGLHLSSLLETVARMTDSALIYAVPGFVAGRIGKYIWRRWDSIRRRHLVYELTHWFVMFVLLAGILACAGMIIATNALGGTLTVPAVIERLDNIITISAGLLIGLLLILFFPLMLFDK